MTTPVAFDRYASLRIPNYRRYLVALLALTVALQVQSTVIAWQVYDITHDALSLGLIGLSEVIPVIALSLYAGHVVDRGSRKRITVTATTVVLLCQAGFLLYTLLTPRAAWRTLPLYAIVAVGGVARAYLTPARTALAAELVPVELYANSATWRSVAWQVAAVAGPALGGVLYGAAEHRFAAGALVTYGATTALLAVTVLALLAIHHVPPAREIHAGPVLESLTTGLRFVWNQPIILGALTLDLFSVFFGGAVALLPIYADRILHVGPQGLGLLRAAPAAGAVAMSLVLAHRPPFARAGRTLLVAVALFGLTTIGFGLSTSFLLSLAFLAASGAADMVSVVVRSTLLQVFTPAHLMGRVTAVNAIFIGSSNEIGEAESGFAARLLGTVPSVVVGGVATIAVVVLVALRVPRLRELGRIEDQPVPT